MQTIRFGAVLAFLAVALPALPGHADSGSGHDDPIAGALLALAVILVCARVGAHVATRLGQAAVLGELVAGVVLGNLYLLGSGDARWMAADPTVDALSRIGVVLLLFEVGLESTVAQMLRVGVSALLVALLGVVAPFGLGWAVGNLLLPSASIYTHAFIGATLAATSVGITARVLKDLGRSQTNEARIILGAAVIDDVLGLVILAVITSLIAAADAGGAMPLSDTLAILGRALGFLMAALVGGMVLSRRVFRVAARLDANGVLLAVALAFCFFLAWSANAIGLAPIVGAFAAGLVLEEAHFTDFTGRGEKHLEEILHPITSFLVPVFFVVMGMRTDLRAFAAAGVLALAAALTLVAVAGKQLCAIGVVDGKADRLTVGIGMIPRGEVGLIFANIGSSLQIGGQAVVSPGTFSAVVVMVIVTTMITPPLLKWSLGRIKRGEI